MTDMMGSQRGDISGLLVSVCRTIQVNLGNAEVLLVVKSSKVSESIKHEDAKHIVRVYRPQFQEGKLRNEGSGSGS
jgi:hypothetical protein